jgi:hypothetical protein
MLFPGNKRAGFGRCGLPASITLLMTPWEVHHNADKEDPYKLSADKLGECKHTHGHSVAEGCQ